MPNKTLKAQILQRPDDAGTRKHQFGNGDILRKTCLRDCSIDTGFGGIGIIISVAQNANLLDDGESGSVLQRAQVCRELVLAAVLLDLNSCEREMFRQGFEKENFLYALTEQEAWRLDWLGRVPRRAVHRISKLLAREVSSVCLS